MVLFAHSVSHTIADKSKKRSYPTFTYKENTGPKCRIAWSEGHEDAMWTCMLKTRAAMQSAHFDFADCLDEQFNKKMLLPYRR